jgi:hypothetical protein
MLCALISQTSAEMPPKNGGVRKANCSQSLPFVICHFRMSSLWRTEDWQSRFRAMFSIETLQILTNLRSQAIKGMRL